MSHFYMRKSVNLSFQLMGIEIDADHGGSQSSFLTTILAVEELAKIDPATSVVCDVQVCDSSA